MNSIAKFFADEDGVTMVEYGLLAALIAVVCVVAIGGVGTKLNVVFEHVRDCLGDVTKC